MRTVLRNKRQFMLSQQRVLRLKCMAFFEDAFERSYMKGVVD